MLKSIISRIGKKRVSDISDNARMFSLLFRHSPLPIQIYDRDGLQVEMNPASEKLWNIYAESTIGRYNILTDERLRGTQLLKCVSEVYEKEHCLTIKHDLKLSSRVPGTRDKKVKTSIIPVKDQWGELEKVIILHQELEHQGLPALLSALS